MLLALQERADKKSFLINQNAKKFGKQILKLKKDPKKTLGIKLPFLVMIIKNLKKYFTFEVQVSSNSSI